MDISSLYGVLIVLAVVNWVIFGNAAGGRESDKLESFAAWASLIQAIILTMLALHATVTFFWRE